MEREPSDCPSSLHRLRLRSEAKYAMQGKSGEQLKEQGLPQNP